MTFGLTLRSQYSPTALQPERAAFAQPHSFRSGLPDRERRFAGWLGLPIEWNVAEAEASHTPELPRRRWHGLH